MGKHQQIDFLVMDFAGVGNTHSPAEVCVRPKTIHRNRRDVELFPNVAGNECFRQRTVGEIPKLPYGVALWKAPAIHIFLIIDPGGQNSRYRILVCHFNNYRILLCNQFDLMVFSLSAGVADNRLSVKYSIVLWPAK